jgi:hypothetical protein
MPYSMEYPIRERSSMRAAVKRSAIRRVQRPLSTLLLFGMLSLSFLLVPRSAAQVSSTLATSSSSGHSSSVGSAGIASFGHTGYAPIHTGIATSPSHFPHSSGGGHEHHRHHGSTSTSETYYPYWYAVPFPYPVDAADATTTTADNESDNDAEYQGGPTVFDRRGSGASSYVTPLYEGPAHTTAGESIAASEPNSPEPQQPRTTLVFKDGHQLEIQNYAIVSQTLYDLTPGHPRKITIADLDLAATEKQNDDRGITFQLPPATQSN